MKSTIVSNTKSAKKPLKQLAQQKKFKLTITDNCLNQLKYLCSAIPNVEWSGILFYTVEGDIEHENLDMTAEFVYPMSKDSQAATSFEYNEDVMQFMMQNPQTMDMRQGLVHSH